MTVADLFKLERIKAVNMRLQLILLAYIILSTLYSFLFFKVMLNTGLYSNLSVVDMYSRFVYSDAFVFFAIITIINIGTDYNKNIYAKQFVFGISKNDFILSKFLFIAVLSIVLVFIELIKLFVLQYLLTHQINVNIEILFKITFGFLLLLFIIGTYAFLIITIMKKIILSIVLFYLVYKAETIISFLTTMYGGNKIVNFMPIKVVENIVNNFIMNPGHLIMLFIYFIASVFFITYILNKKEILLN